MTKVQVELVKDPVGWYIVDEYGSSWALSTVIDLTKTHQPSEIREVISSSISTPFLYTSPALWEGMEDQDNPPLKLGIADDTNLIIAYWNVSPPVIPPEFGEWVLHEYENGKAYFFGEYTDLPLFFELMEENPDEPVSQPVDEPKDIPSDININMTVHVYMHKEEK
jgi:hypothetical protein